MKRFGALEVAMVAGLCGGIAYACAAPEDLDPLVLSEAENRYFSAIASQTPTPPPPTGSNTTPVPPGSVPPEPPGSTPPVAPPPASAFAPSLGGAVPEAEVPTPADAIPLDQWLGQQ